MRKLSELLTLLQRARFERILKVNKHTVFETTVQNGEGSIKTKSRTISLTFCLFWLIKNASGESSDLA